jgi:DNA-binding IclR family transcriptional regulator
VRGLAILGCFTPKCPVLGIADIAGELGMSRSTTHRYVITLVALGYLEQGASRKYRLGLRVTGLGMSALNSTGLREHAHRIWRAAPAHLLHDEPRRARRRRSLRCRRCTSAAAHTLADCSV